MKTIKDFTKEELLQIKSKNFWHYQQIVNNSSDLYFEYGVIKDKNNNSEVVGITTEYLQSIIMDLKSEKFAYARCRNYGITIYHYSPDSPTGVKSVNGICESFMWLIDSITKTNTLSPTDGLCSAR